MHLNKAIIQSHKFPDFDAYPFNLKLLRNIKELAFPTPVAFFVGENGCGKTTLLRALAKACGIHIWEYSEFARYNYNPYEDKLFEAIDIHWTDGIVPGHFFDSRNFEFFSKLIDEWASSDPGLLAYFGSKSLVAQSHGQSHMSFFNSRYSLKGIYFIDEPETALSPQTQIETLQLLSKISTNGDAQFIIATHSPILLALPESTIYCFENDSIKSISYEETPHYLLYKNFITDYKKYINQ